MKVEQLLINNPTIPINQYHQKDYHLWYLELCRDLHGKSFVPGKRDNLVKAHIKALGKQKYCWQGEFKYWIWEFMDGGNLLRVFVNNTKGVCLEVSPQTNKKKAMALADSYKQKVLQ